MADRGRDLKFSILSDLDRFDTDKPAKGLADLGEAAEAAGKMVDKLDDVIGRADLDALHRDAKAGKDGLDKLERGAKDTARNVDSAFDKIAKSSRSNLGHKLDDDLDDAGKALDEFKDEAHSSGREAAASFGGGFDDIGSFIQETAANAFGGFGPLGAAAGIAAAAGIGIITAAFGKSKEKAEEAQAAVGEWIQAYVDGLGTIKEATIQSNLDKFAEDGGKKLRELGDAARDAGVNVADFQRANAGDLEAQKRVADQYQDQIGKLAAINPLTDANAAAHGKQRAALSKVAEQLGYTNSQMAEGKTRAEELREAANRPISVNITAHMGIDGGEIDRATREAWGRADAYFRRNPITIRTTGTGKRPIRDVP